MEMTSSFPEKNWDSVKENFDSFGFKSITKEDSWKKFVSTFDSLWGS